MLIIASPYSWDEEFTKKEKWLTKDGMESFGAVSEILSERFEPIGNPINVDFVLRESYRKFQHVISEVSCWRKKG